MFRMPSSPSPRLWFLPSLVLSASALGPIASLAADTKSKAATPQALPENVVSASREESKRREANLLKATNDLALARKAMSSRDYESAVNLYRSVLDSTESSPKTDRLRTEAKDGFRDSSLELAKVRITEGRYVPSEQILNNLLKFEPGCRAALRLKEQLSTPGYYNKTITPTFRADLEEVKRWLLEAQGFYDSGRFDLAMKRTDQVLGKDPYNIAARKLQEKVSAAMTSYGVESYNEARARALSKVDRLWSSPVRRFGAASTAAPSTQKIESSNIEKLRRKLNDIVLDEIQFTDTPLKTVAASLSERSKEADKSNDDKKGVVIIVQFPDEVGASAAPAPAAPGTNLLALSAPAAPSADAGSGSSRTVSIPKLPGFKLIDILNAITAQSSTKLNITDSYVAIVPLSVRTDNVLPKTWPVSPWFFNSAPKIDADLSSSGGGLGNLGANKTLGGGATPKPGRSRIDAKEYLTAQGVKFDAPNSTATYNPRAQTLTVLNTQDQLDVVDSLVRDADQLAPTQVEIQAKFVEFSQNNLKEISFDWLMGQANLPGSNNKIFSSGGNSGSSTLDRNRYPFSFPNNYPVRGGEPVGSYPMTLGNRQGNQAISSSAIDALLAGGAASGVGPAAFAIAGAFTDPQFQLVVRALNQSKGVDLLSSPSVTARNSQLATIQIVREFRYPTDFQPPQIPQQVGGGAAGGLGQQSAPQSVPVTPSTPSGWDMRETGVRLEVTPTIQGDNYTVDLELKPEVVEFEGFINYGSPIRAVSTSSAASSSLLNVATQPSSVVLTENTINQPIFSVRRVTTLVSILDGETISLGGLIREDVQKVNDKVPVLGDIPLVGRLFRSDIEQRVKKNLTIFVSVRLIDAAGQPVNAKDALEETAPVAPVPSLTEPSPAADPNLPLLGN
jgi:general secretion pathway protein D